MGRIKKNDYKAILNRNRVRRSRLKKQLKSEENYIHHEFEKSIHCGADDDTNVKLRDKLKTWASNHRVTSRAINDLLSILNGSGKS